MIMDKMAEKTKYKMQKQRYLTPWSYVAKFSQRPVSVETVLGLEAIDDDAKC